MAPRTKPKKGPKRAKTKKVAKSYAKQNYVEELMGHGDVVNYISPSRRKAWYVKEYKNMLDEKVNSLTTRGAKISSVKSVPSFMKLALFIADLDPIEGDTRTYVRALCNEKAGPCKTDCTSDFPFHYRETTLYTGRFGRCDRVDRDNTCTETYMKLCRRTTYGDAACTRQVGNPRDILGWKCSP